MIALKENHENLFRPINAALIVLAAGLSERMGVFKPLLPVGGQSAVERCIGIAKAAGIPRIIVVTGHKRTEIESVLDADALNITLVHNSGYMDGMFSSVHASVSALPDGLDGFFLLPSDSCAISPGTLIILMKHFAEKERTHVTRPKYKGRRGHPPLIPAGFIKPLLNYSGENGLKGFLSPLPTLEIEMDSVGALLDMDTPDDYAQMLSYLGIPTYPSSAQCVELLAMRGTPQDIIKHGEHVADVALKIARLMRIRGAEVDIELLESACLLHDICRMEDDHAQSGMNLLLREGYPKAAIIVGRHMDIRRFSLDYSHQFSSAATELGAPGAARPTASLLGEAELLYLADKLCRRGKLVSLEDAMNAMEMRFRDNPEALGAARERINMAQEILYALKSQYDISFNDLN